jgi:hypothetical protein
VQQDVSVSKLRRARSDAPYPTNVPRWIIWFDAVE